MTREEEMNDKIQNLINELRDGIVRLENTPDMFDASIHEIKVYIADLLARIAKLEKMAVVWHRYPDEPLPRINCSYLLHTIPSPVMNGEGLSEQQVVCYWTGHRWGWIPQYLGNEYTITHWAELPAPPEE